MSKTAMKLALEALDVVKLHYTQNRHVNEAITAIKEALAQTEQEPVAHQYQSKDGVWRDFISQSHYKATVEDGSWPIRALYTSPPAQQEPAAWPCLIAEADFSENTVTLAMQCTDYKVSAGTHWLYTSTPAQRTWVGLTEAEITTSLPYSVTRDKGCFHAGALWADAKLKDKNNA